MPVVFITGMSGTGKSTVLSVLAQRGYKTIDTDDAGWCVPEDGDWSSPDHLWILDDSRMESLLDAHDDSPLFVSATRPNQGAFYGRFDHVVTLTAPIEVMIERVQNRSGNPFGRTTEEQEAIRDDTREVEPLLIRGADVVIDTSVESPESVAEKLVGLL